MKKYLLPGLASLLVIGWLLALQIPTQAAPLAQLTVFPTPTPGPDGRIVYIVQLGDTLWRISAITGVPIETIRELNGLGTDETITPGDELVIGFAGPVEATATAGPTATRGPQLPTATASPGWGILCILLYNDENGDSIRQETEVSIAGGAVSVGNRLGTVSLSGETLGGGISDLVEPTPQDLGYVCFEELVEGQYTASAAHPEGYNATTELNKVIELDAGQTTLVAFGAQPNSEAEAETAIIPETPGRSPLLGIVGGALLLVGVGLGVYAALLQRSGKFKRPASE
jgi:murein DD-endopeptidase MepM/ murein hydrolase activator NlpD